MAYLPCVLLFDLISCVAAAWTHACQRFELICRVFVGYLQQRDEFSVLRRDSRPFPRNDQYLFLHITKFMLHRSIRVR
jgi:hypothetical protein